MALLAHALRWLAVLSLSLVLCSPSPTGSAGPPAFTYNATAFLLRGEPFRIIGGQMDFQRIPYQYWRDRLKKARAMGLNAIFSYVFRDRLEPCRGAWTANEPDNDMAAYFRIAQDECLYDVLRPGPYICGVHDFGGFPAWLSQISGLVVRDDDEPYLKLLKDGPSVAY